MPLDLTPTCKKCGIKLQVGMMRMHSNARDVLCPTCFDHLSGNLRSPNSRVSSKRHFTPFSKDSLKDSKTKVLLEEEETLIPMDIFPKKTYVCNSCKTVFSKPAEREVNCCPFCGKKTIHEKEVIYADSIVNNEPRY